MATLKEILNGTPRNEIGNVWRVLIAYGVGILGTVALIKLGVSREAAIVPFGLSQIEILRQLRLGNIKQNRKSNESAQIHLRGVTGSDKKG